MAQSVGNGQVKLNNGQTIAAQNGGWYDGQQYWNGSFGAANVINNPNQQGYGQGVSAEVRAQSAAAQGVSPQQFDSYLRSQGAQGLPQGNAVFSEMTGGSGVSGIPDLEAKYNELTNTPEYQAAQKAFNDLQAQINEEDAARQKAISNIGNNPWYSQATRGGRISLLNSDADRKIANLTNQRQQQQNKMDKITADAQTHLGLVTQQYQLQRQAQQDAYERNAVDTKMFDDGSNVYAVSIDRSGNVVNRQLIGSSTPTQRSGGGGGSSGSAGSGGLTATQQRTISSNAIKAIQSVDNNKDKLLSQQEYQSALEKLMAATGLDFSLADDYLTQAFSGLGYRKWKW